MPAALRRRGRRVRGRRGRGGPVACPGPRLPSVVIVTAGIRSARNASCSVRLRGKPRSMSWASVPAVSGRLPVSSSGVPPRWRQTRRRRARPASRDLEPRRLSRRDRVEHDDGHDMVGLGRAGEPARTEQPVGAGVCRGEEQRVAGADSAGRGPRSRVRARARSTPPFRTRCRSYRHDRGWSRDVRRRGSCPGSGRELRHSRFADPPGPGRRCPREAVDLVVNPSAVSFPATQAAAPAEAGAPGERSGCSAASSCASRYAAALSNVGSTAAAACGRAAGREIVNAAARSRTATTIQDTRYRRPLTGRSIEPERARRRPLEVVKGSEMARL